MRAAGTETELSRSSWSIVADASAADQMRMASHRIVRAAVTSDMPPARQVGAAELARPAARKPTVVRSNVASCAVTSPNRLRLACRK